MAHVGSIDRRVTRCAIYTRKSTDYGLDAAVNSLDTQRDVCQSYIRCQAHRDWVELPYRYDDGGYSGGNLSRPALSRLLRDVEDGRIDMIVIYKMDRLTRSLLDFVRVTDLLQRFGVQFVSVTQSFDTSDSMGRLVLNILLTFAQFERELSSDRVRDKKAAMRKRGLYVGGLPPFGYVVEKGGKLVVDQQRAPLVSWLFEQYSQGSSVRELVTELQSQGCITRRWKTRGGIFRGGQPITAAIVRQIISNPIYTGFFVHRGEWLEAQNEPLVTRTLWDLAQAVRLSKKVVRDPNRDFLVGILHDEFGRRMGINFSAPGHGHKQRYYRGQRRGLSRDPHKAVLADAAATEALAKAAIQAFLSDAVQVRQAIMSLGRYSPEIATLVRRGQIAARRVETMTSVQLRRLFVPLIPRLELGRAELRLYVCVRELKRFLAWDGKGHFQGAPTQANSEGDHVHLIRTQADTLCGKRTYMLPLEPCRDRRAIADQHLVALLEKGAELQTYVLAHRGKSLAELAKCKHLGPSQMSRLIRTNYLAPDIKAAIMDGTQPPTVTKWSLLYGPLPLDWSQQREILGFRGVQ